MTSALVTPDRVEELRAGDDHVVIVDASVILPSPRFDGDHHVLSGRRDWLAARIPGSIHLDLVAGLADRRVPYHFAPPSPKELAARLAARGIGQDTHVIAYDHGDNLWAARLWWTLRWIGVRASVLDGGLPEWARRRPVETGPVAREGSTARVWQPTDLRDAWASLDDVVAISEGRAPGVLVCGLSREAFAGTAPTRYARRGHIPRSLNVPARSHVRPDGTIKGLRELADQWAGLLGEPIVLYCGGGISAALNALALHELGVTDVRIFDGSLEQWSADPERPLVIWDHVSA